MMPYRVVPALAAAAMIATSGAADAASVGVRIIYDTTSVDIYDGDAADLNTSVDAIDWNLSEPTIGPTFQALGFTALEVDGAKCTVCPDTLTMDLEASFRDAPSLLEVLVSGIDFMRDAPSFLFTYVGIPIGPSTSILTEAYVSSNNTFFDLETLVGSEFSTAVFAGQQRGGSATAPYSATLRMVFDFTDQQTTMQAQSQLSPIPVPAALPLLLGGLGMLGLVGMRRRRS